MIAPTPDGGAFLEALTDSSLYSIGAYFCDRHPELVDDVLAESQDIEQVGLARWAEREGTEIEACLPDPGHRSGGPLLQGRRRNAQLD